MIDCVFVQGFLIVMRQEIIRVYKGWVLDVVVLDNEIIRMMKEDIYISFNEGQQLIKIFVSLGEFYLIDF